MLGFPIQISPDQCLVDGSPELFAVTHVFHRFLAPRHPPLALCSLEFLLRFSIVQTKLNYIDLSEERSKMLVLALQFSRCDVTHAELDPVGRLDAAASLRNDSLKTEEKTVNRRRLTQEEGPNPCDPRGQWPTVLPVH